ncbi:polysaccharide pyruvyl transferase family protein [Mycolicibacterium baixiangningiae]|uniref:polysaccharide pyruvyl transferase family protein n=1 Tax=Mycolicibacterium baixiangningiae TaxID=2761578 RepID=UPI001865DAEF|nr:polysaccharide pyruvyl transferase family protein [Mycolicibacterium baixiangningiae]
MGPGKELPALFVLGSGQDDNVGDVVLRREYFDRLRRFGRLHIYLGPASDDFLKSLALQESDVIYGDLRKWHSAAWGALFRGPVWFVDKPGELLVDGRSFRRNVKFLPLILGVRARRGQVLRLGVAMRAENQSYVKILRPLFRLSTCVRWRDTDSRTAFGFGEVGPDWAFGWESAARDVSDVTGGDIAVTYRADREPPSDTIIDSIRALARAGSRRVVVVTQVRRDAERSADLASRLGGELIPWPAERSLAEHENVLREVYRNSAMVISDRLHALIVGMTEGAVPACVTDHRDAKVGRHLDAVGFHRSTIAVGDTSPAALTDNLAQHLLRRKEALTAVRAALDYLDNLTEQFAALAFARWPKGTFP